MKLYEPPQPVKSAVRQRSRLRWRIEKGVYPYILEKYDNYLHQWMVVANRLTDGSALQLHSWLLSNSANIDNDDLNKAINSCLFIEEI